MKKSPLTLALAVSGLMAVAGVAQAQTTSDVPLRAGEHSTMTGGQPNMETNNLDGSHTSVVGAGPVLVHPHTTVTTTTYGVPVYHLPAPVAHAPYELDRGGASETSNVPGRAGEASTMTGGAPNLSTDNLPGHVLAW